MNKIDILVYSSISLVFLGLTLASISLWFWLISWIIAILCSVLADILSKKEKTNDTSLRT